MAYLEPGVYSKTISNRPLTGAGGPSLIPLVIGSGASEMRRTEVIVRGSGDTDTLPVPATEIISVGYTSKKADFTADTDYTFSKGEASTLDWSSGANKPTQGESYSVTYKYKVSADQYLPRLISSVDTLEEIYGSDLKEDGKVNNLALASKIILETGAPEIYVLQVEEASPGTVTSTDYQKALDKHAQFMEDVWRIVPADLDDSINSVIDGHIKKCSSYEERKERCGVYAKGNTNSLSTAENVIDTIGGAAKSKASERVSMVYPTKATRVMSDGSIMEVTGQFIAAAYAGLEASMPLYQSKTRATSGVFQELRGVQLTRGEKNKLAECGVMIFEQPAGAGTNIVCRHQLSTNMDSAEYRENSVLACKDYVAKYLRGILDTYIGKYNITADTISKVTGSINAGLSTLAKEGYILEGALRGLAQDEENPDTLIVDVEIKVPYPCNYIKLTIISE